MKNLLIAALATALVQPMPQFLGSGISVSQNGVVRIDKYVCFAQQTATGIQQPKDCPIRVEFGEDILDSVLICRSTKAGQTCIPLGKVLPAKE